jgi:hypothetical protein
MHALGSVGGGPHATLEEANMKSLIGALLISAVSGVAAIAVAPPALAQVGISVNFGDVAIGYRDGYYDSHHHWHHWKHNDDYKSYMKAHPENYHDYGHNDRDRHDDHGH